MVGWCGSGQGHTGGLGARGASRRANPCRTSAGSIEKVMAPGTRRGPGMTPAAGTHAPTHATL